MIKPRSGKRLLFIFILSFIINQILKQALALPRPGQIDSSVAVLCFKDYGFPSGAAQSAALLVGALFVECKKTFLRLLGLFFGLILCFSRIYLGAHFFTDVLGGLTIGLFLVIFYRFLYHFSEAKEKKQFYLITILIFFLNNPSFQTQIYMALGLSLGIFFMREELNSWFEKTVAFSLALTGFFYLHQLGGASDQQTFNPLKHLIPFFQGFWLSFMTPYLVSKAKFLMNKFLKAC